MKVTPSPAPWERHHAGAGPPNPHFRFFYAPGVMLHKTSPGEAAGARGFLRNTDQDLCQLFPRAKKNRLILQDPIADLLGMCVMRPVCCKNPGAGWGGVFGRRRGVPEGSSQPVFGWRAAIPITIRPGGASAALPRLQDCRQPSRTAAGSWGGGRARLSSRTRRTGKRE